MAAPVTHHVSPNLVPPQSHVSETTYPDQANPAVLTALPDVLATMLWLEETPDAYEDVLGRIFADVKPRNFVEEVWVREIADLVWDAFRLRRIKAHLTQAEAHQGVAKVISACHPHLNARDIAAAWMRCDPEQVERVETMLADAGLTMEHVVAETFAVRIDEIERIDRMTTNAEERRDLRLRTIEWYRSSLAADLRRASEDVLAGALDDVAFDDAANEQ